MSRRFPFRDPSLSLDKRVDDLMGRLTVEEKISQMLHESQPIERLGVSDYNWWNECLHGVARAGHATVFPQAIGMAASFDKELVSEIADAISDEARAKYHHAQKHGNHGIYHGLTYWTPNINIFRDPRWGRGQETYGEDPYLTAETGYRFVKGLQGSDPRHLKLVATPKHFAVHSGPEKDRHRFDAIASKRDMEETYLPAFQRCVVDAKAFSVMGAYNRTNGEACCASPTLLQTILRDTWKFEGYVVSDCGAIDDIYRDHKLAETAPAAAAYAVKNGCDLNCGTTYFYLREAHQKGLITETEIDVALRRLLLARFKLGMFDKICAYGKIPLSVVGCKKHRELALRAARESMVLLKNDGLLPLDRKKIRTIGVVGPNADEVLCLVGNYCGSPNRPVTPLDGIMRAHPRAKVLWSRGSDITRQIWDFRVEAVEIARQSDVVIFCGGLTPQYEGEEGCVVEADLAGDRRDIALHKPQEELLQAIAEQGTPTILVLLNGSAVASRVARERCNAILEAWYPGEEGGRAIADVLFGDYNPAGRLPVTFYKSIDQLPPFDDYSMAGRTYRYFAGEPLYHFGFGLSYTTFDYSNMALDKISVAAGEGVRLTVDVKNSGPRDGDEVVQVYVRSLDAGDLKPRYSLCQYARVHIRSGACRSVALDLDAQCFSIVKENGTRTVEPGRFEVFAAGGAPGCGLPVVNCSIVVTGPAKELPGAFSDVRA